MMKKRKIMTIITTLALMMAMNFSTVLAADFADCTAPETAEKEVSVMAAEISPRIAVSYTRTVTRNYASYSSIPTSISYTEYSEVYKGWFTGTLFFQDARYSNGYWIATFSGTMHGTI